MATNISTSFTDGTSSDAIQSFYNTELLIRASFALIHQIPVKKHTLGMRKGKTMIWRRYTNMSVATTALTEGVNPAGAAKAKTDMGRQEAPRVLAEEEPRAGFSSPEHGRCALVAKRAHTSATSTSQVAAQCTFLPGAVCTQR